MLLYSDMLYMVMRCASPSAHMCLRWLMLTLSGPVELFLLCFIASWTFVMVSVVMVVCSLCVSFLWSICVVLWSMNPSFVWVWGLFSL